MIGAFRLELLAHLMVESVDNLVKVVVWVLLVKYQRSILKVVYINIKALSKAVGTHRAVSILMDESGEDVLTLTMVLLMCSPYLNS
jgi:hypothetical protein